jgi:peptidyl-prolyl cis-trans isomerase C
MPVRNCLVSAIALVAWAAAPVSADEDLLDQVVATVNGTEITVGHMLVARTRLPREVQMNSDPELFEALAEQMVLQELLAQSDSAAETRYMRLALENERRALLADEAVARAAQRGVSDEALQQAYDETYVDADQGQEYNASHILLETEEEALAVMARATRADADFAEIARETSKGPSGPGGGNLGWFAAGDMVAEFQAAVEALSPGDITGPVRTNFGWHVIRLNEVRTMDAPPLEEVRGQLLQDLRRAAAQEYLGTLRESGDIVRAEAGEIDPSVLSRFDLLDE